MKLYRMLYIWYLILTFSAFTLKLEAQSDTLDLRTFMKWDIGIFGTWLNLEYPVTKKVMGVSEIGINPILFGGDRSGSGLLLAGRLRQGFRYYYNRNLRNERGKSLKNNSGNYWGLDFDYQPRGFFWTSNDSRTLVREFRTMPSFGIRRSLSNRLVFDAYAALGYGYTLEKNWRQPHNVVYDFRISFGYILF